MKGRSEQSGGKSEDQNVGGGNSMVKTKLVFYAGSFNFFRKKEPLACHIFVNLPCSCVARTCHVQ